MKHLPPPPPIGPFLDLPLTPLIPFYLFVLYSPSSRNNTCCERQRRVDLLHSFWKHSTRISIVLTDNPSVQQRYCSFTVTINAFIISHWSHTTRSTSGKIHARFIVWYNKDKCVFTFLNPYPLPLASGHETSKLQLTPLSGNSPYLRKIESIFLVTHHSLCKMKTGFFSIAALSLVQLAVSQPHRKEAIG